MLLFFLLAIPFFLFILLKHRNNGNILLPPSPPGLPLIGHLHMQMLDNSAPHVFLWKLSQKYGSLMSLRLGFRSTLVVSSAKMAKEVMKTHDLDFCSRPTLRAPQILSYDGSDLAFSPYNAYWREIRKICVVHLFNPNRVQLYCPIREDEVARLIEKISKLSVHSKPVNLSELMMCLTSTMICRIGFGKRYEEEVTERSRFHSLLNESQTVLASFYISDYFPSMGWVDRLSGLLGRLEKKFKELDIFYQELIDEHLDPNRPKPEQEDIVDVLLQIWKDRNFTIDLNMDNIKAVLTDVFIAGTDTSAATVIWVMTFLMKNPRCMKKIQEEVRDLVGKKGFVNEDDVQDLIYLKAVIKETFRLQPVAPLLLPRETMRKCNIGGYEIPAKTLVYVNAWAVGRDPEAWENPEEFCPERFIGSSIDYKGLDFELIPFGAGRRGCPGIHLGVATVELALANLVYKFDWDMPTGMSKEDLDFDVLPGITVHRKNDLCLVEDIVIDVFLQIWKDHDIIVVVTDLHNSLDSGVDYVWERISTPTTVSRLFFLQPPTVRTIASGCQRAGSCRRLSESLTVRLLEIESLCPYYNCSWMHILSALNVMHSLSNYIYLCVIESSLDDASPLHPSYLFKFLA
ncbi:cytochrome P450 83B1-like [Durio zibethinus]|uniref:Cytochrome P450 83B1-like n=1 Tax=Durio zibethinus TaxID=66656 RepID=A0A6P6AM84_DURZI|nr:cytochrome P450 83B1-like [Durio zibethinus]